MKSNLFQFITASNPAFAAMSRKAFVRFTTRWAAVLAATVVTLGASIAQASDPIGIYALVDKVVYEPNEASAEKIQLWGAFAFATGSGYDYDSPKRGVLYYKLNPAKKETCLKEWADFKTVAGTKQVV